MFGNTPAELDQLFTVLVCTALGFDETRVQPLLANFCCVEFIQLAPLVDRADRDVQATRITRTVLRTWATDGVPTNDCRADLDQWHFGHRVLLAGIQRVEAVGHQNLAVEVSHHRGEAVFRRNAVLGDLVQLALDVFNDEVLDPSDTEVPQPEFLTDLGTDHRTGCVVAQEAAHRGAIFRQAVRDVVELLLELVLDGVPAFQHGSHETLGSHAIHVSGQVDRQLLVSFVRLTGNILRQVNLQHTYLGGLRV